MSISNYSTRDKSLFFFFLFSFVFIGCKDAKEVEHKMYLGIPKTNSVLVRVKPNNFVQKYQYLFSKDTIVTSTDSNTTEIVSSTLPTHFSFLNSLVESAPITSNLIKNHFLKLQPDLSKNWLGGGNVFDHNSYAFLYLSYSNKNYLDEYLKKQSISFQEKEGVQYCFLDETEEIQVLLAKHESHLLLLSHNGEKDSLMSIFKHTLFNSKEDFLSFYKKQFNATESDVDIKLSPSESLMEKVASPIAKDLFSSSDFIVSLGLTNDNLSLSITPDQTIFIDSLFKQIEHTNTGLANFSTNIDLIKTRKFFEKYELLGSIEHELKKGGLDYQELQELITGEIELSYLGKKTSKEKSISYEYDDNFNKVEKIKYTTTSSHDISGKISLVDGTNSIKAFTKRNWILPISRNQYEFIALTRSPISLSDNTLLIGKETAEEKSKHKLYFSINDTESLMKTLKIKDLENYNFFKSGSLILDNNNKLTLKLGVKDNTNELVDLIKDIIGLN